jgi:hypothetical protein
VALWRFCRPGLRPELRRELEFKRAASVLPFNLLRGLPARVDVRQPPPPRHHADRPAVRKTHLFGSHLYIKTSTLPRQARDKHRETTQRRGILCRTSKKLHRRLLDHIVKAPVRFFDVTPVGRIVNRFTSDVGSIDQSVIYQWCVLYSIICTGRATARAAILESAT